MPAFDQVRITAAFSEAGGRACRADVVPFNRFEYLDNGGAIDFRIDHQRWRCDLVASRCRSVSHKHGQKKESVSPGRCWAAFVRGRNLCMDDTRSGKV